MTQENFSDLLQRYSKYLNDDGDRDQLLALGQDLFGVDAPETTTRPSYQLLEKKEAELAVPLPKLEVKIKHLQNKTQVLRNEQPQTSSSEQIFENVLFLQDKNALLLARRHALEVQNKEMQDEAGKLMEQSVQQKVRLSFQMEKLKAELSQALSRSRPEFANKAAKSNVLMEDLRKLNDQILSRINSFKMSISDTAANAERAVLDRYKPHMEQLLGQIYSHSEYLPVPVVIEKFNTASETIRHQIKDKEADLRSEHEQNEKLQKEANQLGESVSEQQEEVNKLKMKNSQLQREIGLLDSFADEIAKELKAQYESLLNLDEEDTSILPSSARAVTVTTGNERKVIKRSGSRNFKPKRDAAIPQIADIEEFIEIQKSSLLKKINQY